MAIKKVTGITLTQEEKLFKNEKNEEIAYMEYSMMIDNHLCKLKPANAESKVRLKDAFEKVKLG